ncbi:MAG: hypothetical protein AB7J32_11550 [Pseudonocardia sp.]
MTGRSEDDLTAFEAEVADVERTVQRRVEPGAAAAGVVVGILMLLASLMLPWTGTTRGGEILLGFADLGVLPPFFARVVVGFGVLGSVLALLTHRWALAWACAVGCGFSIVAGVWAIWSRQVTVLHGGEGPGFGLVLAVLGAVVLTYSWVRIALRR